MRVAFSRKAVLIFAGVQALGLACAFFWEMLPKETVSFSMWIVSVVLLFPGDLISQALIEKYMWMKGFSVEELAWISALLGVLINGVLWFGLRAIRFQFRADATR
jgi:hypothetical protein